jgi:hypothetical protein
MGELSKSEKSELEELRSYKSKVSDRYRRQWARMSLMIEKAKKAGLTVTEKEIEERLLTMKRK